MPCGTSRGGSGSSGQIRLDVPGGSGYHQKKGYGKGDRGPKAFSARCRREGTVGKNRKKVKNGLLVLFLAILTLAVLYAGIRTRGRPGTDLSGAESLPGAGEEERQVQFVFSPAETPGP